MALFSGKKKETPRPSAQSDATFSDSFFGESDDERDFLGELDSFKKQISVETRNRVKNTEDDIISARKKLRKLLLEKKGMEATGGTLKTFYNGLKAHAAREVLNVSSLQKEYASMLRLLGLNDEQIAQRLNDIKSKG